jgi:hypothetical protein
MRRFPPEKPPSEFTTQPRISTHFFAFSRKFFPRWERFGRRNAYKVLMAIDLFFGTVFSDLAVHT